MRRLAALLLTVAAVMWVRRIGDTTATGSVSTALALGFALVGAWLTGDLFRRFHLPRLTGYLLFGILVGPHAATSSPNRWRANFRSSPASRRR